MNIPINFLKKLPIIILLLLALQGCISTSITKVQGVSRGDEICIIKNHTIKNAFVDALKASLEKYGYLAPIKNKGDHDCKITSTYTAIYSHHKGSFLARAQLNIFMNNKLVGQAKYHAPRANPFKWGSATRKIEELVQELFGHTKSFDTETDYE